MLFRSNQIFKNHTGKSLELIEKNTERDNFLDAEEAVEFGLVDEVISTRA